MNKHFDKIEDVYSFLSSMPKFGTSGTKATNFNLSRMETLCSYLDNPQEHLKIVHVAGTNGKGTVCRMLGAVYQTAGYKTAVYTSPHLVQFKERFLINGKMIPDKQLLDFFRNYGDQIQKYGYTYFEISTAIAFWYFAKEKADIAIIEVGLGGRLDATNIVNPMVSVITSIGLDHTNVLGDTISDITAEKAGIIKKHKPVVIGQLHQDALNIIKRIALEKNSKLYYSEAFTPTTCSAQIVLKDPTKDQTIVINRPYQKQVDAINTAVVYSVVQLLNEMFSINKETFCKAISYFDTLYLVHGVFKQLDSDQQWYFDGAHNQSAVKALTKQLVTKAPPNDWTVVLSFMSDKLTPEVASYWEKFPHIYIYSMPGERAATFEQMKAYFPGAISISTLDNQLKTEFERALVIFSGSFYFYSIISDWLGTNVAS